MYLPQFKNKRAVTQTIKLENMIYMPEAGHKIPHTMMTLI